MTDRTHPTCPSLDRLHHRFLAVLPTINRAARTHFRHLAPDHREEAISEMIALTWKHFRRLVERGKTPERFIVTLTGLMAGAVKAGRRLCGHEKSRDVMSPVAQRRHGFRLEALPRQ